MRSITLTVLAFTTLVGCDKPDTYNTYASSEETTNNTFNTVNETVEADTGAADSDAEIVDEEVVETDTEEQIDEEVDEEVDVVDPCTVEGADVKLEISSATILGIEYGDNIALPLNLHSVCGSHEVTELYVYATTPGHSSWVPVMADHSDGTGSLGWYEYSAFGEAAHDYESGVWSASVNGGNTEVGFAWEIYPTQAVLPAGEVATINFDLPNASHLFAGGDYDFEFWIGYLGENGVAHLHVELVRVIVDDIN